MQRSELSAASHLNEFSDTSHLVFPDPEPDPRNPNLKNIEWLPDIEAIAQESGLINQETGLIENNGLYTSFLLYREVEAAHARNGLVSLNHQLGASFLGPNEGNQKREAGERLRFLVGLADESFMLPGGEVIYFRPAHGVDLFEAGYRQRGGSSLEGHFWLWDELAKRSVFLVGTGVSDSHSMALHTEADNPNNFVTWVYSASDSKRDLIEGMRKGRAYFGDITKFGPGLTPRLDLTTYSGWRMGRIVVTDRSRARVIVRANGLDANDELRMVLSGPPDEDGPDAGDATNTFRVYPVTPRDDGQFVHGETIDDLGEHPVAFIRAEVSDEPDYRPELSGNCSYAGYCPEKLFSNPIYFLRPGPGMIPWWGIPGSRTVVDLSRSRIRSQSLDGLTILEVSDDGERFILKSVAPTEPVTISFRYRFGEPTVAFSGFDLTPTYTYRNNVLTIGNLAGGALRGEAGVITITRPQTGR